MKRGLTWVGFACGLLFLCASQAESADAQTPPAETPGMTISCVGLSGPRAVVKAAFDYRAVRAVQHLDEYVTQLNSEAKAWRLDPTRVAKVCRLYALDELADIYTTQLVQFDLADQNNTEAEAVLKELNCCKASYYFTGTFYPSNRLVYSFMYGPNRQLLTEASPYPDELLSEVATRDVENIRRRIDNRKALLDTILKRPASLPTDTRKDVKQEGVTEFATKELEFWRETLQLEPSFSESAKAVLLHDRIWSLRGHRNEATWRSLVIESGKAAVAGQQVQDTTSPRIAALVRFRLGYAYMRNGQREEGVRAYEDMLQKVTLYQKELEDNYSKVQWAQTKEKMAGGAKTALAGTLTALSWGIQLAGSVASSYIPGVGLAASGYWSRDNLVGIYGKNVRSRRGFRHGLRNRGRRQPWCGEKHPGISIRSLENA